MKTTLERAASALVQCNSILARTTRSLEFALDAIEDELQRAKPFGFRADPEKAKGLAEAREALKIAKMHVAAHDRAAGHLQPGDVEL